MLIADMTDLSLLVPSNLEAKVTDNSLILQTRNARGPKASAIVKRHVPSTEFCYFLGLLRSEGGNKYPNSKQISFANMDVKLHSEFIRIAKMVGASSFKAYLYHSGKATPNEVYELVKSFEGGYRGEDIKSTPGQSKS
jgi:hypothetical protein